MLMSPGQRKATSATLRCGTFVSCSMLGLTAKAAGILLARLARPVHWLLLQPLCQQRQQCRRNPTHPYQDQYPARNKHPLMSLGWHPVHKQLKAASSSRPQAA